MQSRAWYLILFLLFGGVSPSQGGTGLGAAKWLPRGTYCKYYCSNFACRNPIKAALCAVLCDERSQDVHFCKKIAGITNAVDASKKIMQRLYNKKTSKKEKTKICRVFSYDGLASRVRTKTAAHVIKNVGVYCAQLAADQTGHILPGPDGKIHPSNPSAPPPPYKP